MILPLDRPEVDPDHNGDRSPQLRRAPGRAVAPDWISALMRGLLLGLCLGLLGGAYPKEIRAQDSTAVEAEGRMLHNPTNRLFYYRIGGDSTVYIRQERPAMDRPGVALPARTLTTIYDRVSEQVLTSEESNDYLGVGFEDQTLVLRVSQQFDLYVLGTLIVVILVGGVLLLWLWRRLTAEQRRRKALVQSRRHLTKGREKERERLAKEIHDGPVQDLHGLHMRLKGLSETPSACQVQEMADELMRVTGELRALSADLHPPALRRFGLGAALRSHADRLRDRHEALRLDMDLADDCGPIPDELALALFRVAQEALNNAAQHGEASRVQVRLRCADDTVDLIVRDDGDGFVPPADWHDLAEQDHYGLLGMRERAEAVGANLDIDSAPGAGTQVRLRCSVAPSQVPDADPSASVPA
ncbi:MAG: sensor histidine kinase [Salinivenus sp.]